MKISELTTDRAADVICEITPYVSNIASDDELLEELRAAIDPKKAASKAELLVMGAEKLTRLVPIVMKKHKGDVFGLLAVMNESTAEEIGKQNILKTMLQIREVIKDKDLMDFFRSCAGAEANA